jgi:hypothetical protein
VISLLRRLLAYLSASPGGVREDQALIQIVAYGSKAMDLDPLAVLMARLDHERAGA